MIFGLWNWALHFKGCHKLKPSGVHRVPTGTREVNRPIYPLWLSFTYSLEQHWFMSYALEYSCYWTWPSRNSGFAHWKWWLSIYIYILIEKLNPWTHPTTRGLTLGNPTFSWGSRLWLFSQRLLKESLHLWSLYCAWRLWATAQPTPCWRLGTYESHRMKECSDLEGMKL